MFINYQFSQLIQKSERIVSMCSCLIWALNEIEIERNYEKILLEYFQLSLQFRDVKKIDDWCDKSKI